MKGGCFLKKRKIRFFFLITLYITILLLFISTISLAATPKFVSKLQKAFEDIESWFLKLATPAAAVAVGVGLFMKKFSFGDEERIRMSKKIIRGTLVSYALLLMIDLILSAIESIVS